MTLRRRSTDHLSPDVMAEYLDHLGPEVRQYLFPQRSSPLSDPNFNRLVKMDLKSMMDNLNLDVDSPVARILLVQSVLGHAQNGHGFFGKEDGSMSSESMRYVYPHATIPHIIQAAGMNPTKVKAERQGLIQEVYNWVDLALDRKTNNRLTVNNQPLLGVKSLRKIRVDPESVLKGMVLAGFMDNFDARMDTLEHFKSQALNGKDMNIGGGETHLIDPEVLRISGVDYEFLARNPHDEDGMKYLRELGLIVDEKFNGSESAYIRRRKGPGTSDDLAFIIAGHMYGQKDIDLGVSAMLGAFVVDAVDTYDKCVSYPAIKGLDEQIAHYIQDQWKREHGETLVTPAEIRTVIYLSAKDNRPRAGVSSSHRRLIQMEGTNQFRPTILSHMAFVKGEDPGKYRVGFTGMDSEIFYKRADSRIKNLDKVLEEAA
jgi:hypothetical protein